MNRFCALVLGVCLSVAAHADVHGVFEMPGKARTEIFYQDDDHIRVSSGGQGYMLIAGDRVYSVMVQGGNRVAMDVEAMGRAMRKQGGAGGESDESLPDVSIRDTGRTETVAGFKGHVHEVTVKGKTREVVLSDHPRVVAVTQGFLKAMARAGQTLDRRGSGRTRQMLKDLNETGYGGILKQQDGLTLITAEELDKPDRFYQLPDDVEMMSMPKR